MSTILYCCESVKTESKVNYCKYCRAMYCEFHFEKANKKFGCHNSKCSNSNMHCYDENKSANDKQSYCGKWTTHGCPFLRCHHHHCPDCYFNTQCRMKDMKVYQDSQVQPVYYYKDDSALFAYRRRMYGPSMANHAETCIIQ